ncbi:hypothetical protein L3X38_038155 [Prunus dulcis]|uniref:Uncharacterized protein n=1 Tax=Prunus dulcis TaxID=3755 RepID=A0AAD4V6C7_PRUDU|nr:hypothetical protein L3X38_038155 [Prunus dulcis]
MRENHGGADSVKTEEIAAAGSTVTAGELRGTSNVAGAVQIHRVLCAERTPWSAYYLTGRDITTASTLTNY